MSSLITTSFFFSVKLLIEIVIRSVTELYINVHTVFPANLIISNILLFRSSCLNAFELLVYLIMKICEYFLCLQQVFFISPRVLLKSQDIGSLTILDIRHQDFPSSSNCSVVLNLQYGDVICCSVFKVSLQLYHQQYKYCCTRFKYRQLMSSLRGQNYTENTKHNRNF